MPARIEIYLRRLCPYCRFALRLLDSKGVPYEELSLDRDPGLRGEMERRSGRRTVPQIFVDGRHVGGYDDLAALDRRGALDAMLFPETRGRRGES